MSFQTNFYNTIFGGSSSSLSFYSMASEMRSINSGAYGRLLKKYYSTFGTQKASSSTSNTSSTSDSTSTKKTSGYDVLAHVSGHDAVSDTKKTTDTDKTSDAKSTSDSTSTKKTSGYDVLAHVSGHDAVSDTKKTSDAGTTANTSVSAEEMTKRLYTSSGSYAASNASSFNTAV